MSDEIIIIFVNNSPQMGVIVHWIYSKVEVLEIMGLFCDEKKICYSSYDYDCIICHAYGLSILSIVH